MRVTLRFLSGELKGEQREVEIPPGRTLTVGRGTHCDVVLGERDRSASSTHAKLWLDDRGALYLTDVGSQYGTFVDGKPTTKAQLKIGSKIQFGFKGPIVLLAEPSAEPTSTPQPRPRPRPVKKPRPVAMTTVRAVPAELLAELDAAEGFTQTKRKAQSPVESSATNSSAKAAPPTVGGLAPLQPGYKPCPFCAEPIREGAIKCRYCHEFLDPSQAPGAPGFQPVPSVCAAKPAPSPEQTVVPLPPPVPSDEEDAVPIVVPPDELEPIPVVNDGPLPPPVPDVDEDHDRRTTSETPPPSERRVAPPDASSGVDVVDEHVPNDPERPRTEIIAAFVAEEEEAETTSLPPGLDVLEGEKPDEARKWKTQTFAVPFEDEEDDDVDENGPTVQSEHGAS